MSSRSHWLDAFARRRVLSYLSSLGSGQVLVREGDAVHRFGSPDRLCPQPITVSIHEPAAWSAIAFGGSVGAGEAYIERQWSCDDLTGLIRLILRGDQAGTGLDSGFAFLRGVLLRLSHWLRRNTKAGSKRNIAAHYDLEPALFELFLDETMMYSSAVFERPDMGLEEAARVKVERICRKLELNPTDHVLEIGTGWGGFAVHAARDFGCRVTTCTISAEQARVARRRVAEAGLEGKVEVLERDYRDLTGQYDKLVSIEMIEAIGHQYLDTFFRKCQSLLRSEGLMLLQCITIEPRHYDAHVRTADFIKTYIFPGSCLMSVPVMLESLTRETSLRLVHFDEIGRHYARTLHLWRQRFQAQREKLEALGFDERFQRMWDFYFCYCEAGFSERFIGAAQLLLAATPARPSPYTPHWELSGRQLQGALR